MESPILKQIVKFLQTRKKQKQWMVVFVFMAVIVGFGTVTALKMMGQAMTCKEKVLDCQLALHEHTKGCFDKDKNVVCGYADYAVHKHNDDCYNAEHKLICRLPEVEKHEHTKKCYEKTKTLVCGQEESDGHQHGDGCYQTEKGDLKCKKEEHSHSDGCYDEEGNLVCDAEEHQHDDDCYKWEDVLVCGAKEGEGGHKHSDKCYDVQETLVCGKLELHTHTDKCFEKIDKNGKKEPGNLKIVCGKTELKEHTHTEDAGCLRTVDAAEADVIQEKLDKEAEETQPEVSKDGNEIFTTDMNEETEGEASEGAEGEASEDAAAEGEGVEGEGAEGEGVEGEASEDAAAEGEESETSGDDEQEDAEAEGEEPQGYEESKTYEGLGYIVTASYNKDANIPEEAKFVAERITEESDEENYKKHEVEYKKSLGNEDATMSALFKLGFYVDGEEVEPASPVMITVQFVDKNGLPEGKPIKVVHFGDDKTEVIDGSKAESGSTSFKTDGFSIFGFGPDEETDGADAEKASVHISDSYQYENEAFHITFHVEGDAVKVQNTGGTADEDSLKVNKNATAQSDEEMSPSSVEEEAKENATETVTEVEDTVGEDDIKGEGLEFVVETINEDSKEYKKLIEYADKIGELDELLGMQMLSYSVLLDGSELDVSGCDITADVTLTNEFKRKIDNSLPEAVAYLSGKEEKKDRETETELNESDNNEGNDIKKEQLRDSGISVYGEEETDIEDDIEIEDKIEIQVAAAELLESTEIKQVGDMILNDETPNATMSFSVNSNMLAIRSAQVGVANPKFKVEYYAKLPRVVKSGGTGTELKVINTSNSNTSINGGNGGALPQNGKGLTNTPNGKTLQSIYLNNSGIVQTQVTETKVYATKEYEYKNAPSLMYFDCLTENPGYKLKDVWVKYETDPSLGEEGGFTPSGKVPGNDGFYKYSNVDQSKLHFTNRKVTAEKQKDYIYINQGTTIRLIYSTENEPNNRFDVTMYDYNITGGKSGDTWNTAQKGINLPGNYKGSGAKYAFGNANCGTGLEMQKLDANFINQYNRTSKGGNDSYQGCSFKMVTGVADGNVQFASGINGLKAFGKEALAGKAIYAGSDLNFKRDGDTYTLTKATVKKDGQEKSSVGSLDTFTKLTEKDNGTTAPFTIWSNNFWPFDGMASELGEPKTGQKGVNVKRTGGEFPVSDNGIAHNNFFGMYYQVKFKLDKDYVGPLEYLFFGDDDMWVFLDGKLICDIGGVHSSVGEYVNLWDWLGQNDKGKEHTLQFFYTERGASGSSCWMQFTIPSVTSIPLKQNTGTLEISKAVSYENFDEEVVTDDEFSFNIKLTNDNTKEELWDDYSYTKYNANGDVIGQDIILWSGSDFTLKKGEKIIIKYLPIGTKYVISESENADYNPKYSIEEVKGTSSNTTQAETEGKVVQGTITEKGKEYKVKYNNICITYELPETGGPGLIIYTIAGVICILLGACFMYTKKARERRV